jgi:hypothetical protein
MVLAMGCYLWIASYGVSYGMLDVVLAMEC